MVAVVEMSSAQLDYDFGVSLACLRWEIASFETRLESEYSQDTSHALQSVSKEGIYEPECDACCYRNLTEQIEPACNPRVKGRLVIWG